jgi:hypothetical protein
VRVLQISACISNMDLSARVVFMVSHYRKLETIVKG